MLRTLVASSLLACSYVALSAAPAAACRPAPCANPPVRVFDDGRVIPGNLAYFKVLAGGATLTLSTTGGTPIAASTRTIGRDEVFAADAPIAEGTQVRLTWSYACQQTSTTLEGQYEFEAGAAAELQVIAPTLQKSQMGIYEIDGENTAVTLVQLTAGDDLSHLYETTWTVDGDQTPQHVDNDREGREIVLRSYCERDGVVARDSCGITRAYLLGPHRVRAEVHVIGAASDPAPVELTVETSCEGEVRTPSDGGIKYADDSGVSARDAATPPPVNNPDAGLGADAGGKFLTATDDDGCRLARGRFDGAWLLLGLALLLRRRRV